MVMEMTDRACFRFRYLPEFKQLSSDLMHATAVKAEQAQSMLFLIFTRSYLV